MLQLGQPASDFTRNATDGAPFHLADRRGRHLGQYFYPKDDPCGCTAEACSFRDQYGDL